MTKNFRLAKAQRFTPAGHSLGFHTVYPTKIGDRVMVAATGYGNATRDTVGCVGTVTTVLPVYMIVTLDGPAPNGLTSIRTTPDCLAVIEEVPA